MRKKHLLCRLSALLLLVALTACRRDMMAPTVTPTETAVTEPTEQPTEAPTEPFTELPTEAPTEPEWEPEYNGALGSAGSLRGTTLLISIFADDAHFGHFISLIGLKNQLAAIYRIGI